jgi:hypothetical protein
MVYRSPSRSTDADHLAAPTQGRRFPVCHVHPRIGQLVRRIGIGLWTQDGQLRRIIRWEGAPDRRVADVWDRYKAAALEAESVTPFGRQAYAHFFSLNLPLPEILPSTERLIVDADENLWALRYRLPWESDYRWDVISPEGEWLGTVGSPPDFTIYQIGPDFVLGVHRDSLGVQRVRVHSLRHSTPAAASRPD